MPVISGEVIAVSTTAIGITANLLSNTDGTPKWIKRATLYVEDASIRMTRTGSNPNNGTKTGLVIPQNTLLEILDFKDLLALRMIRAGGTDASVYVELEQE